MVNKNYYELTQLIERLHRRFLDVLRTELKRMGVRDLNGVQALLLFNIGDDDIAVRDLIERGYYLGSNVSYNVKKLTELGYLEQERAAHDKRSVTLRLTDKARNVVDGLHRVEQANAQRFETDGDTIDTACRLLRQLERIWDDYLRYGADDPPSP